MQLYTYSFQLILIQSLLLNSGLTQCPGKSLELLQLIQVYTGPDLQHHFIVTQFQWKGRYTYISVFLTFYTNTLKPIQK